MQAGDEADGVILLDRGLVKVTAESVTGYTSVLALRGPGELLGELSCIDGGPRSATATAMGPVRGVAVPARRFVTLLNEHQGLAYAVLRSVARRLRESDVGRADMGALSTTVRTALVLSRLSRRNGTPVDSDSGAGAALRLSVTQQELAGAVGASRESVVRVLRVLVSRGLISVARGQIVVHDPEGLEHFTDAGGE